MQTQPMQFMNFLFHNHDDCSLIFTLKYSCTHPVVSVCSVHCLGLADVGLTEGESTAKTATSEEQIADAVKRTEAIVGQDKLAAAAAAAAEGRR